MTISINFSQATAFSRVLDYLDKHGVLFDELNIDQTEDGDLIVVANEFVDFAISPFGRVNINYLQGQPNNMRDLTGLSPFVDNFESGIKPWVSAIYGYENGRPRTVKFARFHIDIHTMEWVAPGVGIT